jgi:hypothetical protein
VGYNYESSRLRGAPLDEVAGRMIAGDPNSKAELEARAEFMRRQTVAAQETATATQRYTKYMLWSVVVLAASALGTLMIEAFRLLTGR